MTIAKTKTMLFALRAASVAALLLAIPAVSLADHHESAPAKYKKHVIKDNFMKFPANAIAVGMHGANKGKLIGACGMFNMIKIMDPDTGEVVRTYKQPEFPIFGSDDVTEAPDGTLYWSNAGKGTIGYVKPDGKTGEIEGVGFINSIAVSRDKKWLWYGACIGKDELWRVRLGPDGLPAKGAKPEQMEAQGGWSNSMDACADGFIYSPTNYYGEVRRIHPEKGTIETIWKGLEFPSAIDINDTTGIIYSTEFHRGNITRIDLNTGTSRVLGKLPPSTDNVAVSDDSDNPRIFGSSFVEDQIIEMSERGDAQRIVSDGGVHFSAISVIGNRVFIKDFGRLMEYLPKRQEFRNIAWGQFDEYRLGKSHDWGVPRQQPGKEVTWTKGVQDMCNVTWGQIGRPLADGKTFLLAGELAMFAPNRLNLYDLETRKPTLDIMDLPTIYDAVMVGDQFYLICKKMPKELRGPEVNGPKSTYMANPKPSMEGLLTDDMEILRVSKDGSQRTSVMQSAGLTAFAQKDGNVYATENQKGLIYQLAKNDKWLDEPVVIAKGLSSPEGIFVGNDGNLLVMESNEKVDAHDGRLVSVDVKTGKSTLIINGLGISKTLNPPMFQVLHPYASVAQIADGTIFMYEPGYMIFSQLEPQN